MSTITMKITSLYIAYAPEFDVSAYGGCQDEALNNLTEEIRLRAGSRKDGDALSKSTEPTTTR